MNKNYTLLDNDTLLVSDEKGNLKKVSTSSSVYQKLINENNLEAINKLIDKYNALLRDNKNFLWGLRWLLLFNVVFFSVAAILHPMIEGITLNSIAWSSMWVLFAVILVIYCPIKRSKIKKEIAILKKKLDIALKFREDLLQKTKEICNFYKNDVNNDLEIGRIFKLEDPMMQYNEIINQEIEHQIRTKRRVLKL